MLRPEPSWTGQSTVLGQVIEGLDVVRKISRLPSTQKAQQPHYRPLQEVRIRKISVQEKAPPAVGGGV
jgi:cyclophilin family peptidyl-prolyl cis-trans isomerase